MLLQGPPAGGQGPCREVSERQLFTREKGHQMALFSLSKGVPFQLRFDAENLHSCRAFEASRRVTLQGPPAGGRGPAKTYIRLEIMGPGPRKWATFVDLNHSL